MAKLGMILSAILVFQGIGLFSIGLLLQFLVPKLGYMAFQIDGGALPTKGVLPINSRSCP